jgi:biopolymer transport protein ExbD
MRRTFTTNRAGLQSQQTMTPLIDVVFLLLIFFLCAAIGQTKESKLETKLGPGTSKATSIEDLPPLETQLWVKLLKSPENEKLVYEINGQAYQSWDEVSETIKTLAEISPETPVILDIADGVEYGDCIAVHDLCRLVKFESINFAVEAGK